MNAVKDNPHGAEVPPRSGRGKYVTLAVLLLWVVAVLTFTFLKFAGGGK
ncbi:MAG: hypothetical protein ABI790_06895 [Betaproteobacteria bacterium]